MIPDNIPLVENSNITPLQSFQYPVQTPHVEPLLRKQTTDQTTNSESLSRIHSAYSGQSTLVAENGSAEGHSDEKGIAIIPKKVRRKWSRRKPPPLPLPPIPMKPSACSRRSNNPSVSVQDVLVLDDYGKWSSEDLPEIRNRREDYYLAGEEVGIAK